MVLGYLLVNFTSLADRKLTKQANAIVFKIFLPCMLFYNVYQSDIGAEIYSRIKLCIWAAGGLLILFGLLCLIVPKVVKQENQQGVVIQGIFRSNYVIFGVAVVQNMYGAKSTTTAAILSAILVPMYNFWDLLSGLLAYQTPVAVSSYIMAQQAGADGQLAGQLVVFSSVLSIFTLFVTIFILRTIGLLGI